MMTQHLKSRAPAPHDGWLPDRRLRNRIIIANTIAWVAIVFLIRLLLI